ncbi:MAG TPA: HlyD family efflux transporter periplasmic adaptor subunit [Nevskiaceae bacterium]|nr:HlyD family efflux transporter periplasmic adaptor subunit [Nevskiaceae bacterium]
MVMPAPDPRPQRLHLQTRYRVFAPAQLIERHGSWEARSSRPNHLPLQLDAKTVALAQRFDGQRSTADIARTLAHDGETLSARQLEGIAAELGQSGLLFPGTHEPLPVPAYTESEMQQLGWSGGEAGLAGRPMDAGPLPPSTVPGSRAYPGLVDAPGGLIDRGAEDHRRRWDLPSATFVRVGALFGWSYRSRTGAVLAAAMAAGMIAALEAHRLELARTAYDAWESTLWIVLLPLAAWLVNFVACAARAHAIATYTPERAHCVLQLGFLGVPVFAVETRGVIERAGLAARLRVIGAPVAALLALAAGMALAWMVTVRTDPRLAQFCATVAAVAWVAWILRANPLVKRDGYLLLTHRIGVLDLREQASAALFGTRRPWAHQLRVLPRPWLVAYAILSVTFLTGMMAVMFSHAAPLLSAHFGGIGFLMAVGFSGAYMYRHIKEALTSPRATLGRGFDWLEWRPSRTEWILIGCAIVLLMFPYRYEPSGDMVVLPHERADVRALVPGQVREVLVAEGDAVKKDQVIARMDDTEARARVAQAQSALAQAEADLALLKKGAKNEEVEVARQRVATARKKADVSRENAQRVAQAFAKKGVTAWENDRARGQADVDAQEVLDAQRQLDLITSAAVDERITAKQAEVEGARATLEFNKKQLADTEIKAPIAGSIASGSLKFALGNFLQRGELLAQVEDTSQLIAEIKLPESSIGEIHPGNPASAKAWAYPGTSFDGTVTSVAPSAENAPYGKVVRVQMSLQDPDNRLKPEMTGSAKASGDRHLLIVVYTRALMRFIAIEVWSWLP